MSVFIRPDTKDGTYSFNFQLAGQRFSGSTGKTRKREAEIEEQRLKDEARTEATRRKAIRNAGPDLTIEQACARYWEEKEKDYVPAARLAAVRHLAWITSYFERTTRLSDIGDAEIARMVAARRGETVGSGSKDRLVSNATVNRSAIYPLQRILNRARLVWKLQVQTVNWKSHRLCEVQERVREASPAEECALLGELDRGYDDAVRFAKRMGARRMEILNLDWTDVDFINNRATLKGKGSRNRVVPFPSDVRALLWSLKDNHRIKVFTYEAHFTRRMRNGATTVRGQRYPLTEAGLAKAFLRAREKAGVVDYRFHDNRHTAATRLLRETGNLRLVQKLLGHASIRTTVKYAHATLDDLAEAMEATVPGKSRRDGNGAKSHTESYTKTGSDTDN